MTAVTSASRRRGRILAAAFATALLTSVPIATGTSGTAQAQAQVSVNAEFRTALQPYGRFERHSRWGEVWIPANRSRDWRPYTVGRWVYTEDWGWYWVEDQEEASWGLVAYHYGRWAFDRELGWCWIAGDEWGPGYVQWRHGKERVGWAPLPPDDIIVEYRERPDVWIFVGARDFVAAPRLARVILPSRDYGIFLRETIVVNQTVIVRDRGRFAVNPGIPPTIIAAAVGRPIRAYDARPRILAGTARIPGAIEVRAQDIRSRNFRAEATVRESRTEIRPSGDRAQQLQPLGANERGRLGDNPPRAARGTPGTPATTGQAPGAQQQPQPQRQGRELQKDQPGQQPPVQQQGRGKQEPAQTQGRGKQEPAQTQGRDKQEPAQTQGRGKQEPAQTQGRGKQEPAQTQGRGKQEPAQTQGRAKQESAPTQGRGSEARQQRAPQSQPQQRPTTEGRGAIEPRRQAAPPPRPEQSTQGRGGGGPSQAAPRAPAPSQAAPREPSPRQAAPQGPARGQPSATEGRGGGGGGGGAARAPERPRGQGGPPGAATDGRGGGPGPR